MGLTVGAKLGERYELVRQLGTGGMGVVWLAKHVELGTYVAIKALRPEVMADKEAVTRFDREARAAASLRGPHVARILDVGRADDATPFIVMEYLEGQDLGAEIATNGPFPIADAIEYVIEACEAMIEAHERGIIHRDLKPENLFLAREGASRTIKILDFGISRFSAPGEMRVTQTQSSFGTPLYMSPEQVRSTKNVDERTDIWSLGVIFYELVTGEPPFSGETPTAVAVAITIDKLVPLRTKREDVPEELDAVVSRALEKEPEKRVQTMRDLADALRPFFGTASSATPAVAVRLDPTNSKTLRVSNAEVPARAGKRVTPVWLPLALGALVLACIRARFGWRFTQNKTGTARPRRLPIRMASHRKSPTPTRGGETGVRCRPIERALP